MKTRKAFLAALTALLLLCVLVFTGCEDNLTPYASPQTTPESKIKVAVTFDAMKELTEAIGRDKVIVTAIIPDGAEPHDFEPTWQDLELINSAQIFVYNGLNMEPWAQQALAAGAIENLTVVTAADGCDTIQDDPHIWLSLRGAAQQAQNIKNALTQADPENAEYYERNYVDFTTRVNALYDEYTAKFSAVVKKSIVTGHAAFGYLCRDFGLEQKSVENIFAEGEPTAKQLAELIDYCKENSVSTIFAEEMISTDISKTLADEVGAKVEVIYTIESAADGLSYLERMEYNLSKIYESLTDR